MSASTTSTCPVCGHRAESHPEERDGSRTCSRSLNALPSCQECAAPLRTLEAPTAPAEDRTLDLMAALEKSVADAKAARLARGSASPTPTEDT